MLRILLVPAGVNTDGWLQVRVEGVYLVRFDGIDGQYEQIDRVFTAR